MEDPKATTRYWPGSTVGQFENSNWNSEEGGLSDVGWKQDILSKPIQPYNQVPHWEETSGVRMANEQDRDGRDKGCSGPRWEGRKQCWNSWKARTVFLNPTQKQKLMKLCVCRAAFLSPASLWMLAVIAVTLENNYARIIKKIKSAGPRYWLMWIMNNWK